MEVDDKLLLIVGDQQGILYEQLTPRPIQLLNIIIIEINYYIIHYSIIKIHYLMLFSLPHMMSIIDI